jgi:class 3 adenylate cyclase/tetratricopeptide (TPR) repeat protein
LSFLDILERAKSHLQKQQRISLRALRREFELDDELLEELVEELVDIQRVAVREERALAWAGAPATPTDPVAPRSAQLDPRSYTPRHLADKILQSKSALEGERKQVTVLFADVKGSMELAEQVDAEVWHGILDRFFQILSEGVHRFEGTVNQYTGDGIMALFGAPIAHEDHAQRACYAALHLKTALREYADELRRTHGLSFSTRIGINSGAVVVGRIGDDLRMDYTAQGQTVGLAQRMEALAEPGCAYLTDETRRLVEGYFALRPLGDFPVKGVSEPVPAHELTGLGTQRTRLDRSRARGFSRFIGRETEMQNLEQALEHSLAGRGRVVGVMADAGTGKSRLCDEFIQRCRGRNLRVLAGHCPAHGQSVAFLPVLELLREAFGIADSDSPFEAQRKIAGELTLLDPEFHVLLPLLFEFLGVPDAARPAPEIDPAERERQLLGFVRHLSQARSAREPGLVFIDDLHWVDPGSEAFVAQLVEVAANTRTMVLVNFRPEYRAEWMQHSHYQQIPLDPLGAEEVKQLVTDLLGTHESLTGLGDHVYGRTGGNPFFVEEIVQSLVESGRLEGERGAYRLNGQAGDLEIPPTVHAVLAARIDRLADRDKRLLQVASVIGREVPEPLLADVAETQGAGLADALAALQRGEFLLQHVLYPEAEYLFKHALTRDVAYASQLAEARARLHAAVARAIERREAAHLDECSGLLAHHWSSAGEALTAAHWHVRASRWAGLTQSNETLRHLRQAIDLLEGVEPTAESQALEAGAIGQILWLGPRTGALEGASELVERAGQLSQSSSDPLVRARLEYGTANWTLFGADDLPGATRLLEGAIALADAADDPELRISTRYSQALCGMMMGAPPATAAGHLESALEMALAHPEISPSFLGYDHMPALHSLFAIVDAQGGRCRQAIAHAEQAIAYTRESDLAGRALAYGFSAIAAAYAGERERALAWGQRAVEISEPITAINIRGVALSGLGRAQLLNEHWVDACEMQQRVWQEGITTQRMLSQRARALAEVGALDAAVAAGEELVAYTQGHGSYTFECEARLDLVEALSRLPSPPHERIEQELERATALIELHGAPVNRPRIHELRARLTPAAHERELREALRLYDKMGSAHAERIERELGA